MNSRSYRPVRLPMYDWPDLCDDTRLLEAHLTDEICAALDLKPSALEPWPGEIDLHQVWIDPGLLLAQTCGYPLTHSLAGKMQLIGAPHYQAEGCLGAAYRSHLVVSQTSGFEVLQDLQGTKVAFNTPDSQSGLNALRAVVAPLANGGRFFADVVESGGHLRSMELVASGAADVAAVDAVCWALVHQERPGLAKRLRSIGMSDPAPGLPFITSLHHSEVARTRIVRAVETVLSARETEKSRQRLRICGFSNLSVTDYQPILSMEQQAVDCGYPMLG